MNRPAEPDPGAPQAGIPHPLRQELWNALTHGLGAAAALAGGAVLITLAAIWGDAWQLAGLPGGLREASYLPVQYLPR